MINIMYTTPDEETVTIVLGKPIEDVLKYHIGLSKEDLLAWAQGEYEKSINNNGLSPLRKNGVIDFIKDSFDGWNSNFEQQLYQNLVWSDVPDNAINPREIVYTDLPHGEGCREFRSAWVDVTPDNRPDIDLAKAKAIKLRGMRIQRQEKFEELGFPVRLDPDLEASITSQETRDKLKSLRDATEPLKALKAEGYNDESILEQIRQLGELNV